MMENIYGKDVTNKIERAHRAKEGRAGRNLPVTAKFSYWNFSEEVKIKF